MNKLQKQKIQLPAKIEDLTKFVLIGREKLVAVRAEIRAIDKIGLAQNVKEQKKVEAQDLAGALLDAEVRIGELLKGSSAGTFKKGGEHSLPDGINKKQSHYFQAMASNPEIVEQVKAEAAENDDLPTRTEVLRKIREQEREQKNNDLISNPQIPDGKFNVIYADPPWKYQFSETKSREIENNYPTMDLEEIKNIIVPTCEDSILYLWATAPKIEEAIEVINSWGFEYKTNLIWDKEIIGMGYWFRGQHELLLVAIKGNFPVPNPDKRISSVYREKRTEHSKKPNYFYSYIEIAHPGCKYLELFARQKINDKWTAWGNEIK